MIYSMLHLGRPTKGDHDYYKRWKDLSGARFIYTDIYSATKDVTVIVTDQYTDITDDIVSDFPHLKYVCSPTTGHTHLKFDHVKHGIKLITLRGETEFLSSITSVAEHTMYLLMRLAKEREQPIKLAGLHMAIIGLGRVGKQVKQMAESMGIICNHFDKEHNRHYLRALFLNSDIISIHLEENEDTRKIINRKLLFHTKNEALIINTARASIVDELALHDLAVLDLIGGVASDVTPEKSPLRTKNSKIILTDHVGGRSLKDRVMTDEFIIEKLVNNLISDI